jgi:hypothetical protein
MLLSSRITVSRIVTLSLFGHFKIMIGIVTGASKIVHLHKKKQIYAATGKSVYNTHGSDIQPQSYWNCPQRKDAYWSRTSCAVILYTTHS